MEMCKFPSADDDARSRKRQIIRQLKPYCPWKGDTRWASSNIGKHGNTAQQFSGQFGISLDTKLDMRHAICCLRPRRFA